VVRARASVVERRQAQAFDVVWCKVPLPDVLRGTARAYLGRGHAALAFPSYDERLQLGWLIDKGTFGELRRRGVEEWVAEMRAHVSPDLAAHLGTHGRDITHPFLLDVVCGRVEGWTRPGLLLLGDAAHAMSPVGAQGINVALRDALVAANHLVPALLDGAAPAALDRAAQAVEAERLPEVATIQALQQRPPALLFGRSAWARIAIDRILPIAVRTGVAQRVFAAFFRRFAYGTAAVRLAA
jgi:2-polyprenyl-6-methoxyphenol hydroxylase-like FAD-dependent oxidoreductase